MQSRMLHGSETWSGRKENKMALQLAKLRMVRSMCGVKLKDRVTSKGLRERIGLHDNLGITAEQAKQTVIVWACAAKRRL